MMFLIFFLKRTIYGVLCFMKNYNIVSKETCESNVLSGMLLESEHLLNQEKITLTSDSSLQLEQGTLLKDDFDPL
jgi:hypothetical protein